MIRLARSDDALAIHNLHTRSVRQLCSADYPEEVIEGWLKNRSPEGYTGIGKNEMYVYEESGGIVGFSHVEPGCIMALFVDPAHTLKGVGRALFDHALPIALSGESARLPFEVTLTAVPFYLKCGCKQVGQRATPKNDIQVDTVLMLLPRELRKAGGSERNGSANQTA